MQLDVINGLFESFGAIMIVLNILAIIRDQELKGVHWGPTIFFTAWSFFNLWFYPANGLWFSFLGACSIVVTNAIWLGLVLYYRRRQVTR